MNNNRYVILNCQTLMGNRLCYGKTIKQCADCTDCVLKQIVELCNIPNCLCDNCDGVGYFDGCADKDCAFYRIMQIQAKLEIEEVE